MFGEIRVVDDVPSAFAAIVAKEFEKAIANGSRSTETPFRIGCSGSGSGESSFHALAQATDLDWSAIECFFVDERCVDPTSNDANIVTIKRALGDKVEQLAGFYPMSCDAGPTTYEALLREHGPLDVIQLGLGPDGHTASIFPHSEGLSTPPGALVVTNVDPSGFNKYERLTLTYEAIAQAPLVIFSVAGKEKAAVMRQLVDGVDLPANRVTAMQIIWLCDKAAAAQISS